MERRRTHVGAAVQVPVVGVRPGCQCRTKGNRMRRAAGVKATVAATCLLVRE